MDDSAAAARPAESALPLAALRESCDRAARLATGALNASGAFTLLLDGDRPVLRSAHGVADPMVERLVAPLLASFSARGGEVGEPLILDGRVRPLPDGEAAGGAEVAARVAAAPLAIDGLRGLIAVLDPRPGTWTADDSAALADVAAALGAELDARVQLHSIRSGRDGERFDAIREQARHAALAADVGTAVAEGGELRHVLQRCAESIQQRLDAAFARVWILNDAEQVLELQASAGQYTHLDGAHGRVPVGAFKIGMIAAERQPHLTNDVAGDPRVSDKDWARREGMVAFAGYPLLVEDRLLGVVAMFARRPLPESALDALRGVADRVALAIDRERASGVLRRRERQLAEAQLIAELGSWEWEVGSDEVRWSDELYRVFGIAEGTRVTYDAYIERIHPDDRALVGATVQRALEDGTGYHLEHRIVRPDGATRYIYSQGEIEPDRQGRPVRIFGVAQDVTERREATDRIHELALEQVARREAEAAQRQVSRILESITDAFFALDRDWAFSYVNREAEKLLQRSATELTGRNLWDEFPDALGSTFEQMYRRAVEEQRTVQFQEYFPPLDGWFDVRAYPSADGLSVYFRDVTEQKRAEQALEYQSYVTRTITDNATAALFMMNEKGHCTYMNPAAEAMTGYTVDEIRDVPLHEAIHHHHPDGRPFPIEECPIDRALPEDFSIRAHRDTFIRSNGEYFPVVCAASPIFRAEVPVGTVVEVRDLTDEQRAARALRESEERFRSLIEATAAIVWTTSAAGTLDGDQPQWHAFTGQRADEYQGWGWLDMIHPDDRERTVDAWKHALATRSAYEAEHRLRTRDGEFRHMLARAVPVLESDGTIREWVGIHMDVTARRSMEERQRVLAEAGAVLASSLDYEATLKSLARLVVPALADWCAVDLLDEDGAPRRVEVAHRDPKKRELARELERRYPTDPDAPTGVPHVLRTGQPELVAEIPDELLRQGARDDEHFRIIQSLGLRSYMVVPLAVRGRTLGAITLVSAESGRHYSAHDLATAEELALRAAFAVDNARLFRELQDVLRQVGAERHRLQELFMQAPAFITTLRGAEHRFEMANAHYTQLVGGRDVVGRTVVEALPEVVGQGFVELLDRVYSTGEPFVGSEVPVLLEQASGEPEQRYLNFVYQPLRDADGSISGIFVHGVDVTMQVRARQEVEEKASELTRLARALERSNRELDQFAYVTSHDLKAPLRGIANLAQWIEEDLGENVPAETREHLELLRGRVQRMDGLIDGILHYSRAGRVRDAVQEVDVGALLDEVLDMLSPPDHVTVAVQDPMPRLMTERLPLQQVLMNLIGNAIKYNDQAEPRIEVSAHETAGGAFEFVVADNGPGIAPEYHERIFGIFQTLQARDRVEGTGIGLSLVRKIVETRGGRVWVESAEGQGARFRFLWPHTRTEES